KLDRSFATMLPCALFANAIILACGFLWLAFVANFGAGGQGIGMAAAWSKGVAPFLLGDAVKAALAAAILPAAWSLLRATRAS
ncbi:MAG: biotin transporter BioY, partial [Hyphomicrobiales bacterium]|nr:biotin transporter BioY [Hyphomicrobiales bacterium]